MSLSYSQIFGGLKLIYSFSRVSELTDAEVQFGLIPNDHWVQPNWINETKASAAREKMIKDNVIYGGMSQASLSTFYLVLFL